VKTKEKKKNIPKLEQIHKKKEKKKKKKKKKKKTHRSKTRGRQDSGCGSWWPAKIGPLCLHRGSADPHLLPSLFFFFFLSLLSLPSLLSLFFLL
jgi:hypothetical protein